MRRLGRLRERRLRHTLSEPFVLPRQRANRWRRANPDMRNRDLSPPRSGMDSMWNSSSIPSEYGRPYLQLGRLAGAGYNDRTLPLSGLIRSDAEESRLVPHSGASKPTLFRQTVARALKPSHQGDGHSIDWLRASERLRRWRHRRACLDCIRIGDTRGINCGRRAESPLHITGQR